MKTLSHDDLNLVNETVKEKGDADYIEGANMLLRMLGQKTVLKGSSRVDMAKKILEQTVYSMLMKRDMLSAAVLMFGYDFIDVRPEHVKKIFELCETERKLSIFGSSSQGKTHCMMVWLLCDYLSDPMYTCVKVASMQETHLKQNLFSSIIDAIDTCIIDLKLYTSISAMKICPNGLDTQNIGILGTTFPQERGASSGRLRGIKPVKRRGPAHPLFGKFGRVRALLDEASSIPSGVRGDFGSFMGSADGAHTVKLMISFNPTDQAHWTAQVSAPTGGLQVLDIDKDHEWESAQGFHCYRLDALQSPNVQARKNIVGGCMTWETFQDLMNEGDSSSQYVIYGRGFWPMKGNFSNVIPMDFLTGNIGEFIFSGETNNVASVDIAFTGDKVVFTLGRWGSAVGFRDEDGVEEFFKLDGKPIKKHCLQIDQQFELESDNSSIKLAQKIISLCRDLKVRPQWLTLDRTSIGKGVYDNVNAFFGSCFGINWQESATEHRIFSEDVDTCKQLYSNVSTEMWFAARMWLENGNIKFAKGVKADPLFTQLSSRRYKPKTAGKIIVESKPDYKARTGGKSPDHADSFVQLPHLCRIVGGVLPSLSGDEEMTRVNEDYELPRNVDLVDSLMFSEEITSKKKKFPFDKPISVF